MTNAKQIAKMQDESKRLYNCIALDAGSSLMDLINRYVELELLLERESNK